MNNCKILVYLPLIVLSVYQNSTVQAASFDAIDYQQTISVDPNTMPQNTWEEVVAATKEGAEAIFIPANVAEIPDDTFRDCSQLASVTFAKGSTLKDIGICAFEKCLQLKEIEIPDSVQEIPERCFGGCAKLERVQFGAASNLVRILREAFVACTSLKNLAVPRGTQIEDEYP